MVLPKKKTCSQHDGLKKQLWLVVLVLGVAAVLLVKTPTSDATLSHIDVGAVKHTHQSERIPAMQYKDSNVTPRLDSYDNKRRNLQEINFQQCLAVFNSLLSDGVLSFAGFLEFLRIRSGGLIDVGSVDQLDVGLLSLFYFIACYRRDCTQGPPSINLDLTTSEGLALLFDLCEVSTEFTDPPTLRIDPFNYVFAHVSGLTASEIFARAEGNTIVQDLERATENVILRALGCEEQVDGTRRHLSFFNVQPYPPGVDYSRRLLENSKIKGVSWENDKYTQDPSSIASTKDQLERRTQECPFGVEATIEDLQDFQCDIAGITDNVMCALATSSVEIRTADQLSESELANLRFLVVDAIRQAINDGTFQDAAVLFGLN